MSAPMSRREFTVESVLAMLAGVTIVVSGCGSSSSPTSPSTTAGGGTTTAQADVNGAISANHGHVATVTGAQITAANAITLSIQGSATHNHTVQLSGDQLRSIAAKSQVAVSSSSDAGHQHTVTFN